jgi:hypothetical protein
LFVRTSSGRIESTPQEDPLARAIDSAVQGDGSLTATLRAKGYAGVLLERDVVGSDQQAARLQGTHQIATTPTLSLYAVSDATPSAAREIGSVPATLVGDALALVAVTIAGTICGVSAVHRRRSV